MLTRSVGRGAGLTSRGEGASICRGANVPAQTPRHANPWQWWPGPALHVGGETRPNTRTRARQGRWVSAVSVESFTTLSPIWSRWDFSIAVPATSDNTCHHCSWLRRGALRSGHGHSGKRMWVGWRVSVRREGPTGVDRMCLNGATRTRGHSQLEQGFARLRRTAGLGAVPRIGAPGSHLEVQKGLSLRSKLRDTRRKMAPQQRQACSPLVSGC